MKGKFMLGKTISYLIILTFLFNPAELLLAQTQTGLTSENQSEDKKSEEVSQSQKKDQDTKTLKEVTVTAVQETVGPFMPNVDGAKIYAGKKTQVVDLKKYPDIQNNNYREAFIQVPGLVLSEETTPLVSIGSRGLNPDRTQFMQVLKDGIPIAADQFGYPESYYTPILQSIDDIQIIRDGSSLLYGPQPGGAINYVTKKPLTNTPFLAYSENAFGSFDYFSTYNAITGKLGLLSYYGYFHERQSEGFRTANSDYEVIAGSMKVIINQQGKTRLTLAYDQYNEQHGEPGGLSRAFPNENYSANRALATRLYDRFKLERYYGYAIFEKEFSENTQLDFRVWGGKYRRWSRRQRGGAFGAFPTANQSDVSDRNFYNIGLEPRIRHNYELLGGQHTFTFGMQYFSSNSPRKDFRTISPENDDGPLRRFSIRDVFYYAVFMENLFKWWRLSIVPGVRLENYWQRINEKLNQNKTTVPLDRTTEHTFVPLFGLGIMLDIVKGVQAYANISQSYRPKSFEQTVPIGTNEIVAGDVEEGHGTQYDFGLRGRPVPFLFWDIDYFVLRFEDQVGTIGNVIQNVGTSLHQGLELSTEVDLTGAYDYFNKSELAQNVGNVSPFVAYSLLDAKFEKGLNKGRVPAYAPRYQVKTGVNYKWRDRVKVSLFATFVNDQFADDGETPNRFIPSYKVWDLLAEVKLFDSFFNTLQDVKVFGGVNNLFDEDYYSRVTGAGIDPAFPRNIYGGIKASWGVDGESKSPINVSGSSSSPAY